MPATKIISCYECSVNIVMITPEATTVYVDGRTIKRSEDSLRGQHERHVCNNCSGLFLKKYISWVVMEHYSIDANSNMQGQKIKVVDNSLSYYKDKYPSPMPTKPHEHYNLARRMSERALEFQNDALRENMTHFEHIEHRMEPVMTIDGVDYVNDSKSTTVNSTWFTLEEMNKPLVLIMGGVNKGNDYSLLAELIREKVKAIVCIGDFKNIEKAFRYKSLISEALSMQQAVTMAKKLAKAGDVVLLSPACASFNWFDNYEHRGRCFKEEVRKI